MHSTSRPWPCKLTTAKSPSVATTALRTAGSAPAAAPKAAGPGPAERDHGAAGERAQGGVRGLRHRERHHERGLGRAPGTWRSGVGQARSASAADHELQAGVEPVPDPDPGLLFYRAIWLKPTTNWEKLQMVNHWTLFGCCTHFGADVISG